MRVVDDDVPVVTIAFTRKEVNLLKRLLNFHIGYYKIPGSDNYVFDESAQADEILVTPLYNILSKL